jgi:hypothetical protein
MIIKNDTTNHEKEENQEEQNELTEKDLLVKILSNVQENISLIWYTITIITLVLFVLSLPLITATILILSA